MVDARSFRKDAQRHHRIDIIIAYHQISIRLLVHLSVCWSIYLSAGPTDDLGPGNSSPGCSPIAGVFFAARAAPRGLGPPGPVKPKAPGKGRTWTRPWGHPCKNLRLIVSPAAVDRRQTLRRPERSVADDACELLVIDGLPEVHGLIEWLEMTATDGTRPQLLRQIQRIEQGMGRGVRSSDDHCVVLLLGARLSQRMHEAEANALFSSATRA